MALQIHDPGRVGLRRGIRAAIALPIATATTLYVLDDQVGTLFAAFGTVGLLVTADYAGSALRRLVSYSLTGLVGAALLVIGWAASQAIVSAVVVTAVIAFCLSFVGLLRGMLAVGIPAVLLIFVVAVTVGGPAADLPGYLLAWGVAVVVSTITALVILPHDVRNDIREALSGALAAAADVGGAAWLDRPGDGLESRAVALGRAIDRVNETYDGKPFRPTGASRRDRALTLLVGSVNNARLLLADAIRAVPQPDSAPGVPGRRAMASALDAALRDLSAAMADPARAPSAAALDTARLEHQRSTEAWVLKQASSGADPESIACVVQDDHVLRMACVLGQQMVALGREVNGAPDEDLAAEPPVPQRPWSAVIRAHLSLHSPWLRIALRSALGLATAILVVQLTGVQHGFWVLLGVLSVLRYDMAGTRSFAVLAVVGTVVGVAIGTAVVLLVGQHAVILWFLLPVAVFLAAWAPVAFSYPVGQAAFSLFILLVLGVTQWPPELRSGLVRVEDIMIGAAVALLVGILLWPRGAIAALHREVAEALRSAQAYATLSMGALVETVLAADLARARLDARVRAERASETYDMAVMQRGAGVRDTTAWAGMTNAAHLLLAVGRILGMLRRDPPPLAGSPDLAASVDAARAQVSRHWLAVADDVEGAAGPPGPPVPEPLLAMPGPALVHDEDSAHAYVIAVWTVNWADHLDQLQPRAVASAPHG